jgi:hypothetical protein
MAIPPGLLPAPTKRSSEQRLRTTVGIILIFMSSAAEDRICQGARQGCRRMTLPASHAVVKIAHFEKLNRRGERIER